MAGYLGQLGGLAAGHGTPGNPLPVICAGDIFDRWNAPAELINFALTYLPSRMYAIPGQHDLPHHSYEDIRKSAYWTLVEAAKIIDLKPGEPVGVGSMQLWGFPWGTPVEPCPPTAHIGLDVAVIHSFIWTRDTGYLGASEEKLVSGYRKKLKGYDVAVFGDNHKGFLVNPGIEQWIFNCGGFMRRKSDEREYQPTVGLLRSDGRITRYKMHVSGDKFLDEGDIPQSLRDNSIGFETFLEELSALGDAAINFSEAIHKLLERENVPPAVKQIVLASLEGAN